MLGAFKQMANYTRVVQFNSPPYAHAQNGRVERANRTGQEMIRFCHALSAVPLKYFNYTAKHVEKVLDVVPMAAHNFSTRYALRCGRKPDLSRLQTFGCRISVLKPTEIRKHKFDCRDWECVYLGWDEKETASICLRLSDGRILAAREVIHYPNEFPFAEKRDVARQTAIEALKPSEPLEHTMQKHFMRGMVSKQRVLPPESELEELRFQLVEMQAASDRVLNGNGNDDDEVPASQFVSRAPVIREQIRLLEAKSPSATPLVPKRVVFDDSSLNTNDTEYEPFLPDEQPQTSENEQSIEDEGAVQQCQPVDDEGVVQDTVQQYLPDHGTETHWRD